MALPFPFDLPFDPHQMYPYVYPHQLFERALDPLRLVMGAPNRAVAERIWRDNLRAYHGNLGLDGFGLGGPALLRGPGLGFQRRFVGDGAGVIYPVRNAEGLYPDSFSAPMRLPELTTLSVGGLERILMHYGLPVERAVLEEAIFTGQISIERALTRQEVLLEAVLEAVGARRWNGGLFRGGAEEGESLGFGLWLSGLGLGGDDADRGIERVVERAIERVIGNMLSLKTRGRDRNTGAETGLMQKLLKYRLIQQMTRNGFRDCRCRSRSLSRGRTRDDCRRCNSEDEQERAVMEAMRILGIEDRYLGPGCRRRSRSGARNCRCAGRTWEEHCCVGQGNVNVNGNSGSEVIATWGNRRDRSVAWAPGLWDGWNWANGPPPQGIRFGSGLGWPRRRRGGFAQIFY